MVAGLLWWKSKIGRRGIRKSIHGSWALMWERKGKKKLKGVLLWYTASWGRGGTRNWKLQSLAGLRVCAVSVCAFINIAHSYSLVLTTAALSLATSYTSTRTLTCDDKEIRNTKHNLETQCIATQPSGVCINCHVNSQPIVKNLHIAEQRLSSIV